MGTVPTEVMGSKLFQKAVKELGRDRAHELLQKEDAELKSVIGECVSEVVKMTAEMKDGLDYKRADDVLKTLKGGLRDTSKSHKLTADLAKAVIQARS